MSKQGARALGRFDPKRETRTFRAAGTNAEDDSVPARLGVGRQLEPHGDSTRLPRVDHDRSGHETEPASWWKPFCTHRAGGDSKPVGRAETAVIPNAERRQAVALAGSEAVEDPHPSDVEGMSLP